MTNQNNLKTPTILRTLGRLKVLLAVWILLLTASFAPARAAEMPPDVARTNYLANMMACAVQGDVKAGQQYEALRHEKIEKYDLAYPKIQFQDMYLVAKIIEAEAGSAWLPDEWQLMVGNVLLNRVESPEFPDSIEACVYQTGQYYGKNNKYFERLTPSARAVKHAVMLLEGLRVCPKDVVFQAEFKQGSGVYRAFVDQRLGTTYFCFSSNRGLYG